MLPIYSLPLTSTYTIALYCFNSVCYGQYRDPYLVPGGLGHQPAGTMTGARGASLQPGPRCGVNPRPYRRRVPREAWPEAEPLGCVSPLGKSRGGTPQGVRALQGARRTQVRRILVCVFRRSAFLYFFRSPGERSETRGSARKLNHRSRMSLRSSGLLAAHDRDGARYHRRGSSDEDQVLRFVRGTGLA
jgi:hypothetical protein